MAVEFPVVVVGLVGCAVVVVGLTVSRLIYEPPPLRPAGRTAVEAAGVEMQRAGPGTPAGPQMTSSQAITACRDAMWQELAPGMSADFPYWHDIDSVREVGIGSFALRSYVDSEGLDGEPFRYHYDCAASGGVVTAFSLR